MRIAFLSIFLTSLALSAEHETHWSFRAPVSTAPSQHGSDWAEGPIDAFVSEEHRKHGLTPAPRAAKRVLIRRLWLDVLGLPPSPSEVESFVSDDDPAAWPRLVERALASPRYGERWGQHWLDVVRYADTHGFEVNTPRENAWPYRDYVIASFNSDKPYNRFVREQLAGDALAAGEATGFLVAAAVLLPGQIGKDEESKRLARQDSLDEIIRGTSASFLGLSIACARCHDHKFDAISQRDYYAFQAFFAGVEYGDRRVPAYDSAERRDELDKIAKRIREIESHLGGVEPDSTPATVFIDEENREFVEFLARENGAGGNPKGTKRGYRDDVGDTRRHGNLSGGRYTWWNNRAGQDVLSYSPRVDGAYRLWISWGVHGSGVHTRDARYVFDRDGDRSTRDDQREIAKVDQYYPAGVRAGTTERTPMWSGFLDVGEIEFRPESRILVRGGSTGTGITADAIVLQGQVKDALPRFRSPVSARGNVERFAPVRAKYLRFTTLATDENNRREPCIDELEVFRAGTDENVALASAGAIPTSSGNYSDTGIHQLKHVNDGRYGNGRSWISNEAGKGWVQIEFLSAVEIDRVEWARDREGKFGDRLAVRYRVEISEDGVDWNVVATHHDRVPQEAPFDSVLNYVRRAETSQSDELGLVASELRRLRERDRELRRERVVYGGKFRKPDATHVLLRGDPEQPGDPVEPAVPAVFAATTSGGPTERERRLDLAQWIASEANPLTARVMVNRIWQHHFGIGLVETPNDFGVTGALPSHPALLDWLAVEFVGNRWSVKHLQRLILESATYRQSARIDPKYETIDADNRFLWRFRARRLEGEAIRDSLLALSGELNFRMGGSGFNFFRSRGGLNGFPPQIDFGPNEFRRMIYAHKIRMEKVPVFGAFDCPDAGQTLPVRSRSTTAIQALSLFNSSFVLDRAKVFASRVEAEESTVEEQVRRTFQMALGRSPRLEELSDFASVAREHGLETIVRVLFNSNEFLFLP